MTEQEAKRLCLNLWRWLSETGMGKDEWYRFPEISKMKWECPLCESIYNRYLGIIGGRSCQRCPLRPKHGWSSHWIEPQNWCAHGVYALWHRCFYYDVDEDRSQRKYLASKIVQMVERWEV